MASVKAPLNLAAALAVPVSELDTGGREQIEYIDIDLMDPDPNNFYELSGLEELAANIELVGLQQPIRVRANPDTPGRFIIVAGHRRHAALRLLVNEGKTRFREAACIRELTKRSPAFNELCLIYANSDTRDLTDAELSKQAERVEMLLYQLKEEGIEFPGRMRDHVAVACKVSKTKLARLKVIREGLIPEYAKLFEDNRLPEQSAYAIARFPAEFQQRFAKAVPKTPTGYTLEGLLKKYEEGWRWEPSFSCSDGTPCKRGDTFLRHDAECCGYEQCGGEKCCMTCYRATSSSGVCDRACSRALAARKEAKNEQAAEAEKQRQKEQNKLKKRIQASAKRLVAAADAAGVPDTSELNPDKYGYGPIMTVATLRAYANGDFGDKYFYSDPLEPSHLGNLAALAQTLHCSADYLLGLTDDLTPPVEQAQSATEPADEGTGTDELEPPAAIPAVAPPAERVSTDWQPGEPDTPGYYFVITGPLHNGAKMYYWTGSGWEHPCAKVAVNLNSTVWCPAPPIPVAYAWERVDAEGNADGR